MNPAYESVEPARAEVEAWTGPAIIEFGSPACGHCRRAQPVIAEGLAGQPSMRHLRVADGPGRPLGRSFRVKLWPTLVFLRDGREVARLVRPDDAAAVREVLAAIVA